MKLDEPACRRMLGSAAVARLATIGPDGPHIVPIVFAVVGDSIVTVVDHKPKTTTRLRRLENLAADPRAAVLADHYSGDWNMLWWVRADATGVVDADPDAVADALPLLRRRYPQYAAAPPPGPLITLHVQRWSGWAASPAAVAAE